MRASSRAKSALRETLVPRGAELAARGDERTGELALLASRGIDSLDDYFSLYLPHLLLAAIAPVAILVAIFADDWISGLIVALTLPLIPLFMALVGAVTGERVERQLTALARLAGHFLDVVSGLPTLKIFGRGGAQLSVIARVSECYRARTAETLRVTFLSSLILELVATVSVAMVAVAIGIRLTGGDLGFRAGLFALVLAPEAYAAPETPRGQLPRERRGPGRRRAGVRSDRRVRRPRRRRAGGCRRRRRPDHDRGGHRHLRRAHRAGGEERQLGAGAGRGARAGRAERVRQVNAARGHPRARDADAGQRPRR